MSFLDLTAFEEEATCAIQYSACAVAGSSASILAPALCATAPASAEIFKCFAKDKTPIYQNFPCQFDSNPEATKLAFAPAAATPAKPKAPPVNVAVPVKPPDPSEPSIGMGQDEVRALLGEPLEIVQDEPSCRRRDLALRQQKHPVRQQPAHPGSADLVVNSGRGPERGRPRRRRLVVRARPGLKASSCRTAPRAPPWPG